MGGVTKAAVQAGGVVTKYGGEMIGKIGKSLGASEEKCNHIEQSADNLGKDIYYAGGMVEKKAEKMTDDVIEASKKAYQSMKDKFHN